MKMKKIILMFSMIAVFFCLTACSDGQADVTFDYTDTAVIEATMIQAYQLQGLDEMTRAYLEDSEDAKAAALLTGLKNMDNAKAECGNFIGYRTLDGNSISFTSVLEAEDVESALLQLVSVVDAEVVEENGNVIVTMTAVYEDRDVEYGFVYEENPAYAYAGLTGQTTDPFQIKEINVTPNYTTAEKMKKAGSNTLMGMGTVFLVLIFISIIIGQFENVAKISNAIGAAVEKRKKKEEQSVQTPAVTPVATSAAAVNPMDDTQLVAVITAAVVAANVASGGSDKLVVRSIKKARR